MIAFKIDENLPIEVRELLRRGGFDALTVVDQNLGGRPDTDVAAVCRSEGDEAALRGRLWIVEETRIRVRQ